MQRRRFLSLGTLAVVAAVVPVANAEDFRNTRPDVWTSHTVDDAIRKMYGDITPIHEGVVLNVPEVASNGASIPINITSDINAKSIAVFQNANPEASVVVFTVHENSIIDYSNMIKMKKGPGTITVVLEGKDGKFYSTEKTITVADGGCED